MSNTISKGSAEYQLLQQLGLQDGNGDGVFATAEQRRESLDTFTAVSLISRSDVKFAGEPSQGISAADVSGLLNFVRANTRIQDQLCIEECADTEATDTSALSDNKAEALATLAMLDAARTFVSAACSERSLADAVVDTLYYNQHGCNADYTAKSRSYLNADSATDAEKWVGEIVTRAAQYLYSQTEDESDNDVGTYLSRNIKGDDGKPVNGRVKIGPKVLGQLVELVTAEFFKS